MLALQGGGAHGAFTWGVLDRLLEDERLMIDAISATSAGAMNAAVLADGYEKGGAKGAREALARFWEAMEIAGAFNPYRTGPFNPLGHNSPFALWLDWLGQIRRISLTPSTSIRSETFCVRRSTWIASKAARRSDCT